MKEGGARYLVLQTAFLGDVILTLPMVQALRKSQPDAFIGFVAIPSTAPVLKNHPAIDEIIVFDKRGRDRAFGGMRRLARRMRMARFDAAIVPHRSLRSAAVVRLARVRRRIGFSTSAGRMLFTDIVRYDPGAHETERTASLLTPLGIPFTAPGLPDLYPGEKERHTVDALLAEAAASLPAFDAGNLLAVAPGSVWHTKRWPPEYMTELVSTFLREGHSVALIGGAEDEPLCREILRNAGEGPVVSAAGLLTPLQSAEVIRRSRVVVSNDSAPMHMAVAMRTPVVAIFGATVPRFGFAPLGAHDQIVETSGLACRPCSIHGGDRCPIETFVCMNDITPRRVHETVRSVLDSVGAVKG